jgi:hypothetical protein
MTMASRTLIVVNDLLMGGVLDRELISRRLGVEPKAAGRYLSAVSKMLGARKRRTGKKKFVSWDANDWAADRQTILRETKRKMQKKAHPK